MTSSSLPPIIGISVAVGDAWQEVPMGAGEGEPWAEELISSWAPDGLAAASLREQLVRLQANLSEQVGPGVTALVWVPTPASGYCGGGLVAANWPVGSSGVDDPAAAAALFGDGGFVEEGDTLLEQTLWSGEFPAGPYAAAHRVTTSPTADEEAVVETVDFVVFPPGSSEFVHLSFTAESISAFDDMPSQTRAVAQTLELTLGGGR
ncbi:MAG TPA: hypothetical protein VN107_08460 [Microbacterium sp.]|nr:hypothetical protein [Microbacterium sp.]